MITQDYLLVDTSEVEEIKLRSSSDQIRQRRERLEQLGFESLSRAETHIAPKVDMATTLWPELKGLELVTWNKFLPTARTIRNFQFDRIPDEALDAIELANQAGCFDSIEIWTPEGNGLIGRISRSLEAAREKMRVLVESTDPMAVGIVKDLDGTERYFSIVRWGEALLPIEKIRQRVRAVDWQVWTLARILPALGIVTALGFYAAGVVTFGPVSMLIWTGISAGGLVVLFIIGAIADD
jgi:hypothetical protein